MKNIALSFSGGGFRAAAYSLGCLSYLNHIKTSNGTMLEQVKYISSTSGGSITNLLYSSYLFKGANFASFYNFLKGQMEGDALLAEALDILNKPEAWKNRPEKSKNLINAFSMVYDRLLGGDNFGIFSSGNGHKPHLEEICVNATEFTNGLPFRFQSQNENANFPRGKIGNGYIYFTYSGVAAANKMLLSDILASSSCFPSGFEPMIFPKDYANKAVGEKELLHSLSYKANEFTLEEYNHLHFLSNKDFDEKVQFGVMDGGITDNQAIDAFIKADDRRANNQLPIFDLYLSCDVASPYMDGYTLPVQHSKWYDFLSIRSLMAAIFVIALWLPAMFLIYKTPWLPWQYITGTFSGIFTLAVMWYLLSSLKDLFSKKKEKSTWTVILKKYKGKFLALSLGFIREMIAARLKSVFILSNDIYLKQIRRMYYDKLFNMDKYQGRVIQNTIYDLSRINFKGNIGPGASLAPSDLLIDTAEKARTMGTTLWFDENHKKDKVKEAIIATGQFTTCYNLLRYLNKKAQDGLNAEETKLWAELTADWHQFCRNPNFLV